jgi:arginase family enzyme
VGLGRGRRAGGGARTHTTAHVAAHGIAAVAAEVRRAIGDRPTYLSFDVGAVDPAFAPGTGTPVPGGLTLREVLQLVREPEVQLVGADVVEVSPPFRPCGPDLVLGAYVLFELLAVAALRESAGAAR